MFLGSIFYPKQMKTLDFNIEEKVLITTIHKTLYHFSVKNLKFLKNYSAFQVLMNDFILNYKDKVLSQNPTFKKSKQDYESGIQYF